MNSRCTETDIGGQRCVYVGADPWHKCVFISIEEENAVRNWVRDTQPTLHTETQFNALPVDTIIYSKRARGCCRKTGDTWWPDNGWHTERGGVSSHALASGPWSDWVVVYQP